MSRASLWSSSRGARRRATRPSWQGREVRSPFAAAGPRAGDAQAAAGEMQAINLQMIEVPPLMVPRVPVISLDAVRPVEFDGLSELEPTEFAGGRRGRRRWRVLGLRGGRARGTGVRVMRAAFGWCRRCRGA